VIRVVKWNVKDVDLLHIVSLVIESIVHLVRTDGIDVKIVGKCVVQRVDVYHNVEIVIGLYVEDIVIVWKNNLRISRIAQREIDSFSCILLDFINKSLKHHSDHQISLSSF
jgi:hypothetical protein